jgi:AI-2 transport protein TqsA
MPRSIQWAVYLVAAAAIVAGLYFFRDTLATFALALILWLGVEGLARWLHARASIMPRWLATPVALVAIIALVGLVGYGVALNVGRIAGETTAYKARIDALAATLWRLGDAPGAPPTVSALLRESGGGRILSLIADGVQSIASNVLLILIYLGFMFSAAAQLTGKLDRIFPRAEVRVHVSAILTAIRQSMQDYLWVQTVLSVLISILTYATLRLIGLPNAEFWCFLIFFLNYIPTIGSIFATLLPTLAALVVWTDPGHIALVAGGVGVWQFAVGNLVQPRMMSESLNLSAIVVLLTLALWGAIWGIAGAFLAAPMTVMIMIVLNQFPSTRWLAILMSADGRPRRIRRRRTGPMAEA